MKIAFRNFVSSSWVGFLLFVAFLGILILAEPHPKSRHPETYINTNCEGLLQTDSKLIALLFNPAEFGWPLANCDLYNEEYQFTDFSVMDGVTIVATVFENPFFRRGRHRNVIDPRGAMQDLWMFPDATFAQSAYMDIVTIEPSWSTELPVKQQVENASFDCMRFRVEAMSVNHCRVLMQHNRYLTLAHMYIDQNAVTTADWEKLLEIIQTKLVVQVNSE